MDDFTLVSVTQWCLLWRTPVFSSNIVDQASVIWCLECGTTLPKHSNVIDLELISQC